VNIRNGNFYLPVQDYYLSCFGFPLEVYRSYNSISTRNGPFGRGWTFNHDIQIAVGGKKGMTVMEADGFVNEYVPVEAEQEDRAAAIRKIVLAKQEEDKKYAKAEKPLSQYEDYEKKLNDDQAFFERQKTRYLPTATAVSKSGKYVSRKRGVTYLSITKTGFLRTTETGRSEEYNSDGLLTRISDRNGNDLRFEYGALSRLTKVNDGCGQSLTISYNKAGKIALITDSLTRKLTYQYDVRDRLIAATALDGETTRFAYDTKDRMISLTFANNMGTTIVYDPKTGYVTEQRGPGTKVTNYEYGKEGGKRWAVVTDNEGTRNRYEYIDAESQIVFVDKTGRKTITTVSACCGKPLSIKDAAGVGDEFTYDEQGNLVAKKDAAKKTTTFSYEPRFNLVSTIKSPDGSSLNFKYDANGNLTYASSSASEFIKLTYESHGKIDRMTNHRNEQVAFSYSRFGKPTKIEKLVNSARTAALDVLYDRTGEITQVTYEPKKPETVQEIKDTLAGFLRILKPSGVDFEI